MSLSSYKMFDDLIKIIFTAMQYLTSWKLILEKNTIWTQECPISCLLHSSGTKCKLHNAYSLLPLYRRRLVGVVTYALVGVVTYAVLTLLVLHSNVERGLEKGPICWL